jgi:hypothetical protein
VNHGAAYSPTAAPRSTSPSSAATLARGMIRRWPLILGLPLVVALLAAWRYEPPPPIYQARLTFAIDVPPEVLLEGSDEGTAAKIGEALIDDLARILPGDVFAAALRARLPADVEIIAGESTGSLSADDRHRVADVTITRTAPPQASEAELATLRSHLAAIARAVVEELEQDGGRWLALLGADGVRLTVVDGPHVGALPPSARTRLELPLRVLLALLVSTGLAALLHHVDPRVHDEPTAAALGDAPVLAMIPRGRGRTAATRGLSAHRRARPPEDDAP